MSELGGKLLEYLAMFLRDPRVGAIVGLIFLDVMLAVAAAIKEKKFDWRRLAEFYQTMVIPYVIGYLAVYLAAGMIPPDWLGPYKDLVGQGVAWMAWLMLIGNLIADLIKNGQALGYDWEAS